MDDKVLVHTASEMLVAEHVIVAVPAPVAKKLIRHPLDDEMPSLLATPYSASINVACVTDATFKLPGNLNDVYGLLIPRKERTFVAAVGIENNKNRSRDAVGHLLNIMLSHAAAIDQMHASDSAIVESAIQSVRDYFPALPATSSNRVCIGGLWQNPCHPSAAPPHCRPIATAAHSKCQRSYWLATI